MRNGYYNSAGAMAAPAIVPALFRTARQRCLLPYTILSAAFIGVIGFSAAPPAATAAETSGFAPILIENVSVTRQLELLRAICDPAQVSMRDDTPVCSTCPSYTSGAPVSLRITNAIEGSFTRPAAREVLLDTTGCEPSASNGGGSVLLEAGEHGWSRTLYQPGFRSNECVRFRTIQQTVSLACNMSSVDHGIRRGKLQWLNLRHAKPVQRTLLEWYDNSRSDPRRLVSVFPHRFMKSDFNSDGRVDLQVSVRIQDETIPSRHSSFVDAMAAGHRLKEAESLRLVYLFDGNTLVLSPISEANRAGIDALLEQTPDR